MLTTRVRLVVSKYARPAAAAAQSTARNGVARAQIERSFVNRFRFLFSGEMSPSIVFRFSARRRSTAGQRRLPESSVEPLRAELGRAIPISRGAKIFRYPNARPSIFRWNISPLKHYQAEVATRLNVEDNPLQAPCQVHSKSCNLRGFLVSEIKALSGRTHAKISPSSSRFATM